MQNLIPNTSPNATLMESSVPNNPQSTLPAATFNFSALPTTPGSSTPSSGFTSSSQVSVNNQQKSATSGAAGAITAPTVYGYPGHYSNTYQGALNSINQGNQPSGNSGSTPGGTTGGTPGGTTGGGSTPSGSSSGSSSGSPSSSSPIGSSGNSGSGGGSFPSTGDSLLDSIYAMIQNNTTSNNTLANLTLNTLAAKYQLGQQMITGNYNAGLAQINAQYSQAFNQLSYQHQNDVGTAIAQQAQLNPYSGPDSNANAYVGKINQAYQMQSAQLTSQAAAAQVALNNEEFQAYSQLTESMNTSMLNFQQQQAQFKMGMQQSLVSALQYQENKQIQYGTQFHSMLDSTNLTGYQSAIKGMDMSTAAQTISNSPLGQLGAKAGYSPETIVEMINNGTINQTKLQLQEVGVQQKQEEIGIQARNADINAGRLDLQKITTGIASADYTSKKVQQYSDFSNAIQGLKNINSVVSGSGGQDFLNAINTLIHNPASDAAQVSATLGVNGTAILTTVLGHAPSGQEVKDFFGGSAQTGSTLQSRLTTAASDVATKITGQIGADMNNPLIDQSAVKNLLGQLQSLNQGSSGNSGQDSSGMSDFASFLNGQFGGKYNITIGQ